MLIIFDFDGTLADSLEVYTKALNETFGTKYTPHKIRQKGTVKIIKEMNIPRFLLPLYILKARQKINKLITKISLFEDMPSVLKKLHTKHELAIVTSNSKQNVISILKKHNLENKFELIEDSLVYFGKYKKIKKVIRKLNYPLNEVFYIGDETRDIEAAKKAGIRSIAVTWGFEEEKLLKKAHPSLIIKKPVDLLKL